MRLVSVSMRAVSALPSTGMLFVDTEMRSEGELLKAPVNFVISKILLALHEITRAGGVRLETQTCYLG